MSIGNQVVAEHIISTLIGMVMKANHKDRGPGRVSVHQQLHEIKRLG
jgi:hypothetical protein